MLEDFGTKRIIGKIVKTFNILDFDGNWPNNEFFENCKETILKRFEEKYHEIPDEYSINIITEGSEKDWRRLIITGYKSI